MEKQRVSHAEPDHLEREVPQIESHERQGIISSFKQNPKIVLYSFGACMSALLWGFDMGVNSITIALPGFKMVFGYEYQGQLLISAMWNALWTAMTSLGMLLGGLLCGLVSDRFGRRFGFMSGSILSATGVAMQYAANEPGLLLGGKDLNGIALGFFLTMSPLYVAEIGPIVLRPTLTAAVNFFIAAGQLTAIGIGNTRFPIMSPASYRVIFAAQWAFAGAVLLFSLCMPESPWYLVRHDKIDHARKSLHRLRSTDSNNDVALEEIVAAIEIERQLQRQQKQASYAHCFRDANFRRTRITCGMFIVQQFTGIAFYAQALYFLGISGLPISLTFKLALGGFGTAMLGTMVSWFLMDRIGRRPLLLTGVSLNAMLLLGVGIAGCFPSRQALYFIGFAMNFAFVVYAPAVGGVTWAISAETSSAELRAKTQSLATVTNALSSWIMNFITPYLINNDQANLGGKAAFVWAALSLLSLIWVWFEVPEVRGRSFAELDVLFNARVHTRKFKSTEPSVSSSADKADTGN